MEQRLIDANAFKKYLKEKFKDVKDQFQTEEMRLLAETITNDFCRDIDEQPTVDAVPVIHAKWVQCTYSDEPPTCSYCGFESSYYYDRSKSIIENNRNGVRLQEPKHKYCPNCGAKMDEAGGERRSE